MTYIAMPTPSIAVKPGPKKSQIKAESHLSGVMVLLKLGGSDTSDYDDDDFSDIRHASGVSSTTNENPPYCIDDDYPRFLEIRDKQCQLSRKCGLLEKDFLFMWPIPDMIVTSTATAKTAIELADDTHLKASNY
jgi:hypothetical protein